MWDGIGGEATVFACGDELIALGGFEVLGFRVFFGEGFADLDDWSVGGSEGERSELMSMVGIQAELAGDCLVRFRRAQSRRGKGPGLGGSSK